MARVYLDTSFVSACVTTRTDASSVYRRDESEQWLTVQRPLHDVFVSAEVIAELDNPAYPNRQAALAHAADIPRLALTDEVRGVAHVLVRDRVMPGPETAGDAVHVAVATVHAIDYLLSWNVRHLANPNKVEHLRRVCRKLGLTPPDIRTPEMLWRQP